MFKLSIEQPSLIETSLSRLKRMVETPSGTEWQRLSEVYGPLVAKWVEREGVPQADLVDVVQNVLIVVVKRIGDFEHRHQGAFRIWLRAFPSNQLKRHIHENSLVHCRILLEDICHPASPATILFDHEHDQYVAARAMKIVEHEFEPSTWSAFHLQVVDNRRPQDVATQRGISVNAVIKSKSHVLKRLRESTARVARVQIGSCC